MQDICNVHNKNNFFIFIRIYSPNAINIIKFGLNTLKSKKFELVLTQIIF